MIGYNIVMRDPTASESIWSIWDQLKPQDQVQVEEIAKTFKRVG